MAEKKLVIRMDADTARLQAGMATASASTRGFGKSVEQGITRHAAGIRRTGMALAGLGAAMTGMAVLSIKAAADFGAELAQVSTMLDETSMELMPAYSDQLREMSKRFGESTKTLSDGLYDILSASIAPTKALEVLDVAARAAAAGITDTGTAADAITTILNSYSLSADQAGSVSDLLFAIVKKGKLNFAELAPSIGKVAATSAIAGVSLEELGASIATITRAGIRSQEAMTAINGILRAFLKPTDDAAKAAKEFGFELNTNTLRTIGLQGVLLKLKDATAEQTAAMFPNIRGLKGIAAAMQDTEGFAEDLDLMLNRGGLTLQAFEKITATVAHVFKQLKQEFADVFRALGLELLPIIKSDFIPLMKDVIKWLTGWVKKFGELSPGMKKFLLALGPILIALGGLLMILPGLAVAIGLLLSPIGLVVAAIAAAVAGFIYFYKTNEKFRDYIDKSVAGWVLIGKVIWAFVTGPAASLWNWAVFLYKNWPEVFMNLFAAIGIIFENFGKNIGKWIGWLGQKLNPKNWLKKIEKPDWTPLLEGFESTMEEFPEIVGMNIGEAIKEYKDRIKEIEETTATEGKKIQDGVEKITHGIGTAWQDMWFGMEQDKLRYMKRSKAIEETETKDRNEAEAKREKTHMMILGQELLREKEQSDKRITEIKDRYKKEREAIKEAQEKRQKSHVMILGEELLREKEESDKRIAEIKDRYKREKEARIEAQEKREKSHVMILGEELLREKEQSDKRVEEVKNRYKKEKEAEDAAEEKRKLTHTMILGEELLREKEQSDKRVEETKNRFKREREARREAQEKKEKTQVMIAGEELLREKEQSDKRVAEIKDRYKREKEARDAAQEKRRKSHTEILGEELLREKEQSDKRVAETKDRYKREKEARKEAQEKKERTHIMILGEELLREKEQSDKRVAEIKDRYKREKEARDAAEEKRKVAHIMILGEELLREKEQSDKRVEASKKAYEDMKVLWEEYDEFLATRNIESLTEFERYWESLTDEEKKQLAEQKADWETHTKALDSIWDGFTSSVKSSWSSFFEALIAGTATFEDAWQTLVDNIKISFIKALADSLVEKMGWDKIFEGNILNLGNLFSGLGNTVTQTFSGIGKILGKVGGSLGGVGEAIVAIATPVAIFAAAVAAVHVAEPVIKAIDSAMVSLTESLFELVGVDLGPAFESLEEFGDFMVEDAERAKKVFDEAEDKVREFADKTLEVAQKWSTENLEILDTTAMSTAELYEYVKEVSAQAMESMSKDNKEYFEEAYVQYLDHWYGEYVSYYDRMLEVTRDIEAERLTVAGKTKDEIIAYFAEIIAADETLTAEQKANIYEILGLTEEAAQEMARVMGDSAGDMADSMAQATRRMTEDMDRVPRRIDFGVFGELHMPEIPTIRDVFFNIRGRHEAPEPSPWIAAEETVGPGGEPWQHGGQIGPGELVFSKPITDWIRAALSGGNRPMGYTPSAGVPGVRETGRTIIVNVPRGAFVVYGDIRTKADVEELKTIIPQAIAEETAARVAEAD